MYEIGEILRWAADRAEKKWKAGQITFYAALAQWKEDPEPAFVAEIDGMTIEELTGILLGIRTNKNKQPIDKLRFLLNEKRQYTHENNLDPTGLDIFSQLLGAFVDDANRSSRRDLLTELLDKVNHAKDQIQTALMKKDRRRACIQRACKALDDAVALLGDS
jgi:hypothetical protein